MTALEIAARNLENATRRSLPAEFMKVFECVMAHYGITGAERAQCLAAARADYANASQCYRSIAKTLEPLDPRTVSRHPDWWVT